ncbi:MAG: methyltransferase type 11, partial [uncultured bacterium]
NHWGKGKYTKHGKLKFMVADAHKLPFSSNYFDAVFALEVLEHVFEPVKVFQEVKRVLKKNGYALFLVPSDNFLFKNIVWPLWTRFRGKIWSDTHIQTYNNDFLKKMVEETGFKVLVNQKFILGMLNVVKVMKV